MRAAARQELAKQHVVRRVRDTDEYLLRVPEGGSEASLARELLATGLFEYAEPDWILYPLGMPQIPVQGTTSTRPQSPRVASPAPNCPQDPYLPQQWHHGSAVLSSCEAWSLFTGPLNVGVGVCDTGLRLTHEDLLLHQLEGYNAVDRLWASEGGAITPVHYHGTRTSGMVAANGDNGLGICGVGWNLSHRMVRVSNLSDGGAQLSNLQHGARTSIEAGDRVANVSYHGASLLSNGTTATYIKELGGLLVWGSGNTGATDNHADRDADDLIVVGATTANDTLWTSSTHGSFMDLVAPGAGIFTTDASHDSDYATASGTSYAAPLVSGACAMIMGQRPNLSPSDVERILKLSARDLGPPGLDIEYGYGRLHLLHALTATGLALPTARIGAVPREGTSPLEIQFRDLSTGVPDTWNWDFGDGTTSSLQNPSHTYTSSGAFTVSLTVSNALGADQQVEVDYILADIIPPLADFEATPTAGMSPLLVQFTDQSAGGVPTSWSWDFGDGTTSTLPNPTHTYATSGIFTVSLTTSNAYGSDQRVRQDLIAVDFIPPQAGFSAQPTMGPSPLVVQFTDESTAGVATSWLWTFGDGGSSTLQNPSHTYTMQGDYSVRLQATNAWGSHDLLLPNYISVGAGPELLADFTATPLTGSAPLQVQFQDLSIGNIASWEWEFGDGATSSLQHPVHTYQSPGTYDVSLQVNSPGGSDNALELPDFIVVQ